MNANYIVWACMAVALFVVITIMGFFIKDLRQEWKEREQS